MTHEEKKKIRRRTRHPYLYNQPFIWSALYATICLIFTLYGNIFCLYIRYINNNKLTEDLKESLSSIQMSCNNFLLGFFVSFIFCLILIALNMPEKTQAQDNFLSIGFNNALEEVPRLLKKKKIDNNSNQIEFIFQNPGISLNEWENQQQTIEAAFDINIIDIAYGRTKKRVVIHAVPSKYNLPDFIEWDHSYLNEDDFVLTLGEGYAGPVRIDIKKTPHILLGGETGSGKTNLLHLIIMQCLQKKDAEVYIADFKGGVDFPPVWHEQCYLCFDEDSLDKLLSKIIDELELRKRLFKENACSNLSEYNKITGNHLKRLILAFDEIAEVLDKTSANKTKKEKIASIESKMSIIARQGRAFAINLIISTQRPDATLIGPQIKSNMGYCIAGRCNSILSQIILDSSEASKKISKNSCGRFLMNDGTLFQAFWMDEKCLIRKESKYD